MTRTAVRPRPGTTRARGRVTLLLALLVAVWMAPASPARGALTARGSATSPSDVWMAPASPALGAPWGGGLQREAEQQDEPTDAMVEELGHALGMTPEEVEALGLTPAEMQVLLAGFTEETVVVGSRAEARSATSSAVPVDVLSATDLVRQGSGNLKDTLRTIVPSFAVNTQPIQAASTVVRPAMLRNLAPDHTLVLINGAPRTTCKLFSAMALLVEGRPCFPR